MRNFKEHTGFVFVLVLIVFTILTLFSRVYADMHHSGSITSDETWTLAGSPHIVDSLTTVRSDATLTIEPGVEVRFNENAVNPRLIIGEGGSGGTPGRLIALIAQGTAAQNIIFTSNAAIPQPGDWSSISFNATAKDNSIIEHAIIEYGGAQGGIDISGSNPTIRNCTIRRNLNAGIYFMCITARQRFQAAVSKIM
jgi:hypothetical protein